MDGRGARHQGRRGTCSFVGTVGTKSVVTKSRVSKDRPDVLRREDRVVVGIQEGRPLGNSVDGEARRGASKVLYLEDKLLHTLRIHNWILNVNTNEKREPGEKRPPRTRSGNSVSKDCDQKLSNADHQPSLIMTTTTVFLRYQKRAIAQDVT